MIQSMEGAMLQNRHEAASCILKISDAFNSAGYDDGGKLDRLAGRIRDASISVIAAGEFKSGKSTLVNSLLGEKILPVNILPCTAAITEVVYSSVPAATMYFKNPLPKRLSPHLHPEIMRHIRSIEGLLDIMSVTPMLLPFKKLSEYITIPKTDIYSDDDDDEDETPEEVPFSRVLIEYPLNILRKGMKIIDSPGLNEDEERTRITKNYLSSADAVIFVFRCPKVLSMNERTYIEQIRSINRNIFFACNAFDLVSKEERRTFAETVSGRLIPLTDFGRDGVFFVSSKTGYGIDELKSALSDYMLSAHMNLQNELIYTALQEILSGIEHMSMTLPSADTRTSRRTNSAAHSRKDRHNPGRAVIDNLLDYFNK